MPKQLIVTGRTLPLSGEFMRLNARFLDSVGRVRDREPKQAARGALGEDSRPPAASRRRVASGGPAFRVTIVSFRPGALDGDNLIAGAKPLRDAIAASLGLDDRDDVIAWECGQVRTDGQRGTLVRIEALASVTEDELAVVV